MPQTSIKGQIEKELDILSVHLQKKVLDYVIYLAHSMPPRIKDGEKLTKLAGLITHEEAEELTEIINTGCEQIDNERCASRLFQQRLRRTLSRQQKKGQANYVSSS